MESMAARVALMAGGACFSSWWMKANVDRAMPGLHRLMMALPVVLINHAIPFLFCVDLSDQLFRVTLAFLTAWISNFKILAFCLNRGPLCNDYYGKPRDWTFWQYTALLMLPMLPRRDYEETNGILSRLELQTLKRRLCQFVAKTALLLGISYTICELDPPAFLKGYIYALSLYGFLGFWMDLSAILGSVLLDMELTENFKHPYVAVSFADFWSRWNKVTGILLRCLSYDIIMEGRFVRGVYRKNDKKNCNEKRCQYRRAVAIVVLFILSGIMHEMVFWYSSGFWGWGWFAFFTYFGPALVLENAAISMGKHLLKISSVPRAVGIFYLFIAMSIPANQFFVPQSEQGGSKDLAKYVLALWK
ncbi:hypothetical protein BSKO_06588 [Bryopsis sp. KO-2023]|nr:hypothetical protein BSKO_06588 [Bryopsis sp. KO-2023]